MWIRQIHRWLSIIFTVTVVANFVTMAFGDRRSGWSILHCRHSSFCCSAASICSRCPMSRNDAASQRPWIRGENDGRQVTQEVAKVAKRPPPKVPAKPTLLSGGNPQIAKGYGDAPVQAYIAAMPGWKRDVGRRLDALITRTVPDVRKAVKWNSPLLRRRGRGLVPRRPLLHEVHQGGVLPRHVAAILPARRVQEQGRALPRHPRGRPARRSAIRRLGEAGQPSCPGGFPSRALAALSPAHEPAAHALYLRLASPSGRGARKWGN